MNIKKRYTEPIDTKALTLHFTHDQKTSANQIKKPICDILDAVNRDDLDDIEVLTEKWVYYLNIRHAYQYIQIDKQRGLINCFMKVYVMMNNQWVPHGYGNLYKNKFILDGCLQHLFKLEDLHNRIQWRRNSDTHLVVMDNNTNKYLLYNPYPEVMATVMEFYRKLCNDMKLEI